MITPKIAKAIQSLSKYGVSFIAICQEPIFNDDNYPVTEVVDQNTYKVWMRCNSAKVRERMLKDCESVLDPYFVKRTRETIRQINMGTEEYETESETIRKKGGSKTIGKRERSVFRTWVERTEEHMNLQEQGKLLKDVVSQFGPGQCLINDGEVDSFYFPELNQWIGEKEEQQEENGFELIHPQSNSWLRRESSIQPKPLVEPSNDLPREDTFDPGDLF